MVELEAGLARKRHLKHNFRANRDDVADADVSFVHALRNEVLAKTAGNEPVGSVWVCLPPTWVVRGTVCSHGVTTMSLFSCAGAAYSQG